MMCCMAQKIEIKKQNMLKNDAGLAAIPAGGTSVTSQIKEFEENSLLLTCSGAWSAVTTTAAAPPAGEWASERLITDPVTISQHFRHYLGKEVLIIRTEFPS